MANDYMAKLAADLEGMSMMREPEPMVMVSMACLLYTSPSPRDGLLSRMPSSA